MAPMNESVPTPTLDPLTFGANFLDRVGTFGATAATLVATVGASEGRSFLVPFADLSIIEQLEGEGGELEAEEALAAIVPLDNAAFLLMSLAENLAEAVKSFSSICKPDFLPEPTRITATRQYVEGAKLAINKLGNALEGLSSIKQDPVAS